jgi:hypothetical protein
VSTASLLTEAEAAQELSISPRTLRALRKKGVIRYVALSARTIRYRPEDCEEYIAASVRVESPPASGRTQRRAMGGGLTGNVVRFSQRKG